MTVPTAFGKLTWMADQVRSGRPLADVAAEIGWSEADARSALRRAGLSLALSFAPQPERAADTGEPVLKLQADLLARLRTPRCALVLAELVALAERRTGNDRVALRRAVSRAAMATGRQQLYDALLDVAAVAVRWAEAIGASDTAPREGQHYGQAA